MTLLLVFGFYVPFGIITFGFIKELVQRIILPIMPE
jgi:hypothetical protein